MQLLSAHVYTFRNIVDSGEIAFEPTVTALVGKNESGKTAVLDALHRLKPHRPAEFNLILEYPRWRRRGDERDGELAEVIPIEATFKVDPTDRERVIGELGFDPLPGDEIRVGRSYAGVFNILSELPDEASLIQLLASSLKLADPIGESATLLSEYDGREREDDAEEDAPPIVDALREDGATVVGRLTSLVEQLLPTFFLFSEFAYLPASINLGYLAGATPDDLTDADRTALSLIRMSGAEVADFMDEQYEERIAELEASANQITNEIFEYWSQNDTLRARFDAVPDVVEQEPNARVLVKTMNVRIEDDRHQMSTPFDVRSTGFRWFFSFLAAFFEYESRSDIVVLLDEPGVALHGRAQQDLLRFIEDRLGEHHQVVYSTHSPFLVRPGLLGRVRTVEDSPDLTVASTVTGDIRVREPDTLFPLHAALGYDIASALLPAGFNIVAEGISDYLYLVTMSDLLASVGRVSLDERWNVIPVGGASNIATFIALLGIHLDLTVLVDTSTSGHQRIEDAVDAGLLDKSRVVEVGTIVGKKEADIEDLFTPGDYLKIYNEAFGTSYKVGDLPPAKRIVKRIEAHIGTEFNHRTPAQTLVSDRDLMGAAASKTLDNWERLSERLNETLLD